MKNDELCLALMRADTEDEVIDLLTEAGYWAAPKAWRLVGDSDNNYSSIGNQQSEAVAALIEKVINGVDARLMNACWTVGVDPESPDAPRSIRAAVARFFEGKDLAHDGDGRISDWTDEKATSEGRLLTLTATGHKPDEGMPSISIADRGEGQEPDRFPDTFMSLHRSNKLRVHFVQGKYNMGGTGALQFCSGEHKLQLVVSRRNPALVTQGSQPRARQWGFTIVRREWPKDGSRSSVFTYLAPEGASASSPGGVLAFDASSWPIFPDATGTKRDAYCRASEYGSLVKLYEYDWGTKSNIVMSGGGLLQRLDVGLPELALPVRVFECRPGYSGHSGSFSTNVLGLTARLQKDKRSNLEPDLPSGSVINLDGKPVKVRTFVFKPNKGKDYRTAKQGVVFAVNGQSHATFSVDFFRRKTVGMSYLADSLLVLVDCSAIDGAIREDLFMNSRDRLRDTPLAKRLEKELEVLLRDDTTLRELRNRRRSEELSEKLADSKPLINVLQDILKSSPTLAKLFLQGIKLSSPFPPAAGTKAGTAGEFHGKTYPTYFRFKGLKDGEGLARDIHQGSRVRIALETDAEDEYFYRELDPGASRLIEVTSEGESETSNWTMRGPRSGLASVAILDVPEDAVLGEVLRFRLEVTDPSRIDAFLNEMELRVCPPAKEGGGHPYGRPTHKNAGSGSGGGSSMLQIPNIVEVTEADWKEKGFTDVTALQIRNAGQVDEDVDVFDYYVNVDNKYLRICQKESKTDPKLIKAKFVYGLVLVGLALVQDDRSSIQNGDSRNQEGKNVEALVDRVSLAIAPVLLPLLELIGGLDVTETD